MIKFFHLSRQKIADFFLTNSFLRKVKIFLHQSVIPLVVRALLALVTLLFLIFVILEIFKPTLLTKLYDKASFYFFYYLNLDNQEFNQINVSGNNRVTKEEIINIVNSSKKQITQNESNSYQPLIQNLIDEIKAQLPWGNKVVITRSMPNILNISITEYEPFAIWHNDGKKYVIDRDGNAVLLKDVEEFRDMIILSGSGANTHARSLFNIFAIDPVLSENVYSATWIGNRRWDIRFNSGLLVKLPEINIAKAWQDLIKLYNTPGSVVGLKIIDLRISDKTYFEYDDSTIRELKSL